MSARPNLRVVDTDTGEVSDCPSCAVLQDQVAELEREARKKRAEMAQLRRDKAAWAQNHPEWSLVEQLFAEWKVATGHTQSPFTIARFEIALPYVENPKYGAEMIRIGIRGLAFDPFKTRRRNGSTKRHDGWEQILFKSSDSFEECCNRAPRDAA